MGKYFIFQCDTQTHSPFLLILFIFCYSTVSAIIQLKSFFSSHVRAFSFIAPKALHAWKWEYEWEKREGTVSSCLPDCRLLRHSEIGQLSANPPNLTLETISSQSARSSAVRRDNQSTTGKQKRQSGRKQQGIKYVRGSMKREVIKKRRRWKTGREFYLAG